MRDGLEMQEWADHGARWSDWLARRLGSRETRPCGVGDRRDGVPPRTTARRA